MQQNLPQSRIKRQLLSYPVTIFINRIPITGLLIVNSLIFCSKLKKMVFEKADVKFACYIYHTFLYNSDEQAPKRQDPFPFLTQAADLS